MTVLYLLLIIHKYTNLALLCKKLIQLVTSANHLVGVDLMVFSGGGGFRVSLCGRAFPEYKCQVFNTKNFWTFFLTIPPDVYGKIHAVIRRTSEFGVFLLPSLAKGWESIPLYHSGQVHPDFSTMIDMRKGVGDYFPQ
jgi:hypothetical protein